MINTKVLELLIKYWAVIVPLIGLAWAGITNWFEFKRFRTETDAKIAESKVAIAQIHTTISTNNDNLEHKLFSKVAEHGKEVALRLADQEKRSGEQALTWTNAFNSVMKQLEIMNMALKNMTESLHIVSARTESIEKNEYIKVVKELEELKRKHNE